MLQSLREKKLLENNSLRVSKENGTQLKRKFEVILIKLDIILL